MFFLLQIEQVYPADSRSIARFGTLLCKLSIEADKQTKRIVCLTIWLVVLTVVLTVFTAILVYKEFYH